MQTQKKALDHHLTVNAYHNAEKGDMRFTTSEDDVSGIIGLPLELTYYWAPVSTFPLFYLIVVGVPAKIGKTAQLLNHKNELAVMRWVQNPHPPARNWRIETDLSSWKHFPLPRDLEQKPHVDILDRGVNAHGQPFVLLTIDGETFPDWRPQLIQSGLRGI